MKAGNWITEESRQKGVDEKRRLIKIRRGKVRRLYRELRHL